MINDIFNLAGKPTLEGAGKGKHALHALRHPLGAARTARRVARRRRGTNSKML
jgi:hypothetical protein